MKKQSPIKFDAKVTTPDGARMEIVMTDVAEGIVLSFFAVPFDRQAALLEKLAASHERLKAKQPPGAE